VLLYGFASVYCACPERNFVGLPRNVSSNEFIFW